MIGPGAGWRLLLGGSGENGMDRRLVRRFVELAGGAEQGARARRAHRQRGEG